MTLKTNFILSVIALAFAITALTFISNDNDKLKIEIKTKKNIIDSLEKEITSREYQYEKYDILLQELDTPTLKKIDSVLQNIE